jgi:preprotein translocase subunit YajC
MFNNPSIFLLVGMFVVMYFFMIRPQQQKQKDQKKMLGGLHGKVISKDETTVTLSAGGGARLTFDKASITRVK